MRSRLGRGWRSGFADPSRSRRTSSARASARISLVRVRRGSDLVREDRTPCRHRPGPVALLMGAVHRSPERARCDSACCVRDRPAAVATRRRSGPSSTTAESVASERSTGRRAPALPKLSLDCACAIQREAETQNHSGEQRLQPRHALDPIARPRATAAVRGAAWCQVPLRLLDGPGYQASISTLAGRGLCREAASPGSGDGCGSGFGAGAGIVGKWRRLSMPIAGDGTEIGRLPADPGADGTDKCSPGTTSQPVLGVSETPNARARAPPLPDPHRRSREGVRRGDDRPDRRLAVYSFASGDPEGGRHGAGTAPGHERPGPLWRPSSALFATIFAQNWENVRGIKSERIWFMNIYSVISAGSSPCSRAFTANGDRTDTHLRPVPLFTDRIDDQLAVEGGVGGVPGKDPDDGCTHARRRVRGPRAAGGPVARYPAFRWVFPIFYFSGTALFVGLLVYQLASGGHP